MENNAFQVEPSSTIVENKRKNMNRRKNNLKSKGLEEDVTKWESGTEVESVFITPP